MITALMNNKGKWCVCSYSFIINFIRAYGVVALWCGCFPGCFVVSMRHHSHTRTFPHNHKFLILKNVSQSYRLRASLKKKKLEENYWAAFRLLNEIEVNRSDVRSRHSGWKCSLTNAAIPLSFLHLSCPWAAVFTPTLLHSTVPVLS